MDATFRTRRSNRNQGAACLLGFLAWGAGVACLMATAPNVKHRVEATALMAGLPFVMAGLSLWMLVAYWRDVLTIRGGRVTFRGVFRRTEVDLRDVTAARWRTGSSYGSLALRSDSGRIVVCFDNYEPEERDRLARHLRAALDPAVQAGWNLFAYKVLDREARASRTKPGPGEVLVHRSYWNRYFVPALPAPLLIGVAGWWTTGRARYLFGAPVGTLLLLAIWALSRALIPKAGRVERRVSMWSDPDLTFLLLWGVIGLGALALINALRRRLEHPDAAAIVVGVVWFAVMMVEAVRMDRRRARRDRETADLAAKACGEAGRIE